VHGIRGDAEAGGDRRFRLFGSSVNGAATNARANAIGDGKRLILIVCGRMMQNSSPAEADDFVDSANGVEESLCHFLQRARAGEMAVEVVDHLQVVEVEEDDAEDRAVAARALHLLVEVRLEKIGG
jgi:hypothetical protein